MSGCGQTPAWLWLQAGRQPRSPFEPGAGQPECLSNSFTAGTPHTAWFILKHPPPPGSVLAGGEAAHKAGLTFSLGGLAGRLSPPPYKKAGRTALFVAPSVTLGLLLTLGPFLWSPSLPATLLFPAV